MWDRGKEVVKRPGNGTAAGSGLSVVATDRSIGPPRRLAVIGQGFASRSCTSETRRSRLSSRARSQWCVDDVDGSSGPPDVMQIVRHIAPPAFRQANVSRKTEISFVATCRAFTDLIISKNDETRL